MMRVALVLLALLTGAFAGCTEAEPPTPEPIAEETKNWPAVFGTVFDQTGAPLADAEVQLFELQVTNVTGPDGRFEFHEVPETASFLVLAQKDGYTAASAGVDMVPGFLVRVNLTLTAISSLPGLVDIGEYRGLFECEYVITGPAGSQEACPGTEEFGRIARFPTYERLKTVIVETFWEPSAGSTSRLQTTVMASIDGTLVEVGRAAGESPVRIIITEDVAQKIEGDIHVAVDLAPMDGPVPVGAGVAIQQDFETFASMFYNRPAADGYTIG